MSFSSEVKAELARQIPKSRHCQIAELCAFVLMDGELKRDPLSLELTTENALERGTCEKLLQKGFQIGADGAIPEGETRRLLGAFKWFGENGEAPDGLPASRRCNGLLLQKTCCKRAYIRGAFLAAGSMSDPNKAYHFEIVCRTPEQADQLMELMNEFEVGAKVVRRQKHFVVYIKEGSGIVDMLNVMEAYVSLMNLENVRILKEMRNSVNRKVNCETANISKTVDAAVRQVEDIRLIRDRMGLEALSPALREMALLRLEYPEAALKELGELLDPPVGKSGVNHRLRKLGQIAEGLRES